MDDESVPETINSARAPNHRSRRRRLCWAIGLGLAVGAIVAQRRVAAARLDGIEAADVRAVEAAGMMVPTLTIDSSRAAAIYSSWRVREADLTGTAGRRCVEATGKGMVRSGDFIAGSFARYQQLWKQGLAKISWLPVISDHHGPLIMHIRGTRIGDEPQVFDTILDRPAVASDGLAFPSSIRFPQSGRWLIVATADKRWGCFLLDLTWVG